MYVGPKLSTLSLEVRAVHVLLLLCSPIPLVQLILLTLISCSPYNL